MADPQALHAELVDWLDDWERDVPQPEPLLAAMRAVLELHKPVRDSTFGTLCVECSMVEGDLLRFDSFPCRTVRVISSALGVTTDG